MTPSTSCNRTPLLLETHSLMPPFAAVSSFQETYTDHMTYDLDYPKKQTPTRPVAIHGGPPSDGPTAKDVQLDGHLLNSPASPLVFRHFRDSMNDWYQDDEGGVESTSPPSRFTDALDRKSTPSAKDDLDTLGISASCPSPSYRFLLAPTHPAPGSSRDPPRPTLAPRSTSLPVYTLSKLGVDIMARPATPLWSGASDETSNHSAEPAQRSYGTFPKSSHAHPASASSTSLSIFRSRKLWNGTQSRSELSTPRSTSPTPSARTSKESPPAHGPTSAEHLAALYPAQSVASIAGGHFAPTPMLSPRTPRPKVKTPTEPGPAAVSPLPSPDKHPKLMKMRRLISRRSISSFDALSEASTPEYDHDHDDSPSVETPLSYFDVGRLSEESKLSIGRPEIKVFVPDESSDSPRMYTHFVVGDVWEERDLNDVIPVLRSMRSTGRC